MLGRVESCASRAGQHRSSLRTQFLPSKQPFAYGFCGTRREGSIRCGFSASWRQDLAGKPAARASILTGTYITFVGLALTAAPLKTFGILFDTSTVARGWIQVGGILAMLFGIYYIGAEHQLLQHPHSGDDVFSSGLAQSH
ncbi:hypothetical protein WJX84_000322 [Apatococcus fuscideae]|uniref:EamA domain-containing protein n=1 Tax=Apatococcus fuscideae TaxID=2026836 RepID=A0AAW1RMJ6_9CHLO